MKEEQNIKAYLTGKELELTTSVRRSTFHDSGHHDGSRVIVTPDCCSL